MKKSLLFSLVLSFFVAIFAVSFVYAQTEDSMDNSNSGEQVMEETESSVETVDDIFEELEEEDKLEGVEVEEVDKIPSGFGMWLRDWRERISLALTFDSVKKAEKQLLYAEERMKIAEKILEESTNPNAQQKAEQMLETAQKHIDKIQERRDKWGEKTTEEAERLKNNLAVHHLRKDKLLEKIEEKIPEEDREKFENLRERLLDKAKIFLGDLDDGQLTEKTSEHLRGVYDRIETQITAVKEYNKEKREILANDELSNEEKREQIQLLHDERKTKIQQVRIEFKEQHEGLRERAERGDFDAGHKLQILKDAKEVLKKQNELLRERSQKIKEIMDEDLRGEELEKKLEEFRMEFQEKADEFRMEIKDARQMENDFLRDRKRIEDAKEKAELEAERIRNNQNDGR